ncbi:DNA protecting protein DprA [Candidatus Kaiserbacteria bacterium RIFCSPHIGHO2_02_FULL_59_21]|uniref:Protecting protein DprA protein n=2 Tax=Candidatus Kaiseribacteriota TaxID=1752734 RepID=A0A0G1YT86_9BACT|nr:MAG: protecting protein DprA protein [Candidatus Kaiserbacteria bacterium GW2011_GWA2_58_9]OGG62446.1 MAG: DNA protecting protein DprA [Candidatus Kaiserbacteria bacterium RIFCSPHIGHO2_01_FULL_58_22]OGG67568.1 MAG: DNA protecting protein DprA [Candidatus Kaiserbacteria bacterium RIFCSPHIGHO2_02_FULL_59_21]OGG80172.1 MAG: DNA protecting protein DprA [Candidatus Kaiserbacteria bacterium RIFCSPLOWO2_01_FULL_59_34]OGG86963.1 MAG: DNA protecting protein DprA [Candidatus Kaiserbacteria bacterium R
MDNELKLLPRSEFPPLLRQIPDAPKQLYARGGLPGAELSWLCVVGSRALTNYGRQAVRHLIEGLRGYPVVIVSGLAYGADAEAHRAALEAGLPIVAVPGSGLDWDVLYPRANVNLAKEILKAGGALLSEFEPETKAADWTFPKRNRVMAGLCRATLIIEAKELSGSLITARLTVEYNRELLVVPGSIFSEESKGTHQFLRLGATPVTSAEDILVALGIEKREGENLTSLRADLSPEEIRVIEIIKSPLSRNDLIDALALPITEANVLLSAMEIKGLIIEELGFVRIR